MSRVTGVAMTHVPYKGAAPARQDLMTGAVDIFMTPYGKTDLQLVEQGKMKLVAALSAERQDAVKQAPTLHESQALKGFVFDTWSGYFVHKDTPEQVVQELHKALGEVANDPAIRSALEAHPMVVPRPRSLDELGRLYGDYTARYRAIAKSVNVQGQ